MISEIYGLVVKKSAEKQQIPKKLAGARSPASLLSCRFQHIFNENSIPGIGVVDEHMGHSADQFAVLDNRRARHE